MERPETIRCDAMIPTLAVGDVAAAIDWYVGVLGFEEAWRWGDPPSHAAVTLDGHEIHLSASAPSPGGSWLYFAIDDVDAFHEKLVASEAGVEIVHAPEDQAWQMREMPIRDLVGNDLNFGSPIVPAEPTLPIEREDVGVRLERRLAALLRDLAESKGMTLGELFEETFLHTFEAVDTGGVASPHTRGQLALIAALKARHGIDYDVHASYRFAETDGEG